MALAAVVAVLITGVLLVVAARLVHERPLAQDITDPVPVSLVAMPRDEVEPEEQRTREPEPPREPPQLDFAPELPAPSLTAPALAGPAVALDPALFGQATALGELVFEAGDLDTPPRATVATAPVYPYKARQRRIEGTVQVRFLVRRDGTVGEVIIESAEPTGVFEEAVREAVSRWRFEPGRLAGEAVAAWVVQPLRFDLSGGRP
jgi:protein TonB